MKLRPIRGKDLEHVAARNGIARKLGPWWWPWWPLRESDAKLRARVAWKVAAIPIGHWAPLVIFDEP